MKPVLILQARPEDAAADGEFAAILRKSGLSEAEVFRVRLERDDEPPASTLDTYSAIILGGGPGCVSDPPEVKTHEDARIEAALLGMMPEITGRDLPFLGCCLGIGILGHHLGPFVSKERFSEPVGVSHCDISETGRIDPLLAGVKANFDAFVGHKEALQQLPPGCVQLVSSPTCEFQMIKFGKNVYATQFHPEADAAEFELRINLYRNRGYFPPEDAERLIALCRSARVTEPEKVLRNFVARYVR